MHPCIPVGFQKEMQRTENYLLLVQRRCILAGVGFKSLIQDEMMMSNAAEVAHKMDVERKAGPIAEML